MVWGYKIDVHEIMANLNPEKVAVLMQTQRHGFLPHEDDISQIKVATKMGWPGFLPSCLSFVC